MENKKNTKLFIGAGIVLVIIIALWLGNKNSPFRTSSEDGQSVESTEDTSFGSINAGSSQGGMSYADALTKYNNSHIALDEACKANPNKLSLALGGYLMVDNTSDMDRVVTVGSPFNLRAHGFKIIQLSSSTSKGATVPIGCDQSQNVATVLVE